MGILIQLWTVCQALRFQSGRLTLRFADTRLTVRALVRGRRLRRLLQNDLGRLARAEKNLELLLASRPAERAPLLAWQAGTAFTRAAVAHEAGQAAYWLDPEIYNRVKNGK